MPEIVEYGHAARVFFGPKLPTGYEFECDNRSCRAKLRTIEGDVAQYVDAKNELTGWTIECPACGKQIFLIELHVNARMQAKRAQEQADLQSGRVVSPVVDK
jgi:hypothetical protein